MASPWPFGTYTFEANHGDRNDAGTCEVTGAGVARMNASLAILAPKGDSSGLRGLLVSIDLPRDTEPTLTCRLVARHGTTVMLDRTLTLAVETPPETCLGKCPRAEATLKVP